MNLNGEIYLTASLATGNYGLIGKTRSFQSRMFPRRFVTTRVFLILSVPRTADVSSPRTCLDDNRCDADVSLFDRLLRPWVLFFPRPPSCRHANRGRSRSAFDTSPTQITDTKQIFEVQIPLDRVEVAVHRSSTDHPPANTGQYVSHFPYSADSLSQNPCSR
jgi:hypothetical protein